METELPELADLLADQFAVLDDVRPVNPRAVRTNDQLVFTFDWPFIPADAMIARSSRRAELVRLRELLLHEMTDYFVGVIEIDLHRTVRSSTTALGDDPRHAFVSFTLDGSTESAYGDEHEALRNWSSQPRRHARERQKGLISRRAELRRVRERLAKQARSRGR